MSVAAAPDEPRPRSRFVFLTGPDHATTRMLTRSLQAVGLSAPALRPASPGRRHRPEVDNFLPGFHRQLLRTAQVQVDDARPRAWLDVSRAGFADGPRSQAVQWLSAQCASISEGAWADRRLHWFVPLWQALSARVGVEASFALVLQPAQRRERRGGADRGGDIAAAAGWLNHVLHLERATRGRRRVVVLGSDLQEDWTLPVRNVADRFDLGSVGDVSVKQIRRAHRVVTTAAPRHLSPLPHADVPKGLRALMDESWDQLSRLARSDEVEEASIHSSLDRIRREYVRIYDEAEHISSSTAQAAKRAGRRSAVPPEPAAPQPKPPGRGLGARISLRGRLDR